MYADHSTPTSAAPPRQRRTEPEAPDGKHTSSAPAFDHRMSQVMAVARVAAISARAPQSAAPTPPAPSAVAYTPVTGIPERSDAVTLHEKPSEPTPQVHVALRVLVVDDQVMLRNGIQFSLLAYPEIEVVGQASCGEEALELCAELHPDVVLMDLLMPGMGGVAAIASIHAQWPEIAVLALSNFPEGQMVEDSLQAGALGYLLKDAAIEELVRAIRLAQRGMPTLAATAAQALVQTVTARPPKLGHDLSERESQVLELLTEGLSNLQIAERLVITPATVKFHARSIRAKLGTSSRTETVVIALQHHLVPTK